MGVPAFFGWILRNLKSRNVLVKKLINRPKALYIDANCFFHPQCFKILKYFPNETNPEILEDYMIKRIIKFSKFLENYVNPTDYIYFAVDGVAPIAKQKQQRGRRIRSILDTEERNKIKQKYGIASNDSWSNIVITPGTNFMEKLHKALLSHFQNSNLKYIYSSYHTNGEGEHKILQHIKHNKEYLQDSNIVIYGLDADLIFLAMASNVKNIYLLRESMHFGNKEEINDDLFDPISDVAEDLLYVSIDSTINGLNNFMNNGLENNLKNNLSDSSNFSNFSLDFIFLCFFLGNDFLPHFPSIEIKIGGIENIINCYVYSYNILKEPLIKITENKFNKSNKFVVNNMMFQLIIDKLGSLEEEYFESIYPEHINKMNKRKCIENDDCSRELWNLENMRNIDINNPIKLGLGNKDEWKYRYYAYHYKVSKYMDELVDNMCYSYLEGMMWVANYYYDKCSDWKWQYMYNHAPFISDIANYIRKNNIDINDIIFKKQEPVDIYVQLMCVLPPQKSYMLPNKYAELVINPDSEIKYLFPTKIKLDMLYKTQYYQCIPLLPPLDINKIIELTKDIKLNKIEKNKNKKEEDFICKKIK